MSFKTCFRFQCLLLLSGLFITSCKEEEASVTVKTYHVEKVTASTGDIRGTVNVSNAELVEAGICYAPGYSYPSLTNSKSHSVPATGNLTDFVVHLSGLSSDSTYYFRAYARTKDTSYYGIIYSFTPVAIPVDLVFVQGGTFSMGATEEQVGASADELPTSSVTLSDFRIGRKEVTVAEFVRFLNSRHVASTGTAMTSFGSSYTMILPGPKNVYYDDDSDLWRRQKGYAQHPVTFVSWYGAHEFCRWAGLSLPTEAEWEYPARGGLYRAGKRFAGSNVADEVAWYKGNTYDKDDVEYFAQVGGGKMANELGLYDMSGNVWEWCADWYAPYSETAKVNPVGPTDEEAEASTLTKKVRRGGGWADSDTLKLRVSGRAANSPSSYAGSVGFRYVKRD